MKVISSLCYKITFHGLLMFFLIFLLILSSALQLDMVCGLMQGCVFAFSQLLPQNCQSLASTPFIEESPFPGFLKRLLLSNAESLISLHLFLALLSILLGLFVHSCVSHNCFGFPLIAIITISVAQATDNVFFAHGWTSREISRGNMKGPFFPSLLPLPFSQLSAIGRCYSSFTFMCFHIYMRLYNMCGSGLLLI